MRVAFYGASGTGKTTAAEFVSREYGIPINPVGSRSVAQAMGFASPYDVDAAGKRAEFQRRLIAEKMAWEAVHDDFVTDRTVMDNLAYTALHDIATIDEELLWTAERGVRRYTHIVYCPLHSVFRLEGDPARVESIAYHYVFDRLIRSLLEPHVVPWCEGAASYGVTLQLTLKGSVLERRQAMLRHFLGEKS